MIRKYIVAIILGTLLLFIGSESVFAGFGITPPYVKSKSLTRNSIFEKTIYLVRSDPVNDLRIEAVIDAPDIESWITIDKGSEFIMERGQVKLPMKVTVQVPDDVDFKNYRGAIRIRTSNADNSRSGSGAVSIALGAQIDIDLTIIDKEILDFRVRQINISDLNAGTKVGWLYFPGKIEFGVKLENTGNTEVAPSSVTFDIYDGLGKKLLESTQNTNRIEKVTPFETKEVVAELPTKLPPGNYIARYKIYNLDDIKQEGEVSLSILPHGTIAAAGYGIGGLSVPHKLSIFVPLFIVLAIIIYFAFFNKKKKRRRRRKA